MTNLPSTFLLGTNPSGQSSDFNVTVMLGEKFGDLRVQVLGPQTVGLHVHLFWIVVQDRLLQCFLLQPPRQLLLFVDRELVLFVDRRVGLVDVAQDLFVRLIVEALEIGYLGLQHFHVLLALHLLLNFFSLQVLLLHRIEGRLSLLEPL